MHDAMIQDNTQLIIDLWQLVDRTDIALDGLWYSNVTDKKKW